MNVREFTDREAEDAYRRWEKRSAWHLGQAGAVLEALRSDMIPLGAQSFEGRVSGSKDEAPAPMRVDPTVDADELWSVLCEYAGEIADKLGATLPASVGLVSARRDPQNGIAAGVLPGVVAQAARDVARWLTGRADVIYLLHLDESEDFLFGLTRRLRTRWVIPLDERTPRRQCGLCLEWRVTAQWVDTDTKPVLVASCRGCGAVYSDPETQLPEPNTNSTLEGENA